MSDGLAVLVVIAALAFAAGVLYGIGDWRHRRSCELCRRAR
jgi:hypothetical protein